MSQRGRAAAIAVTAVAWLGLITCACGSGSSSPTTVAPTTVPPTTLLPTTLPPNTLPPNTAATTTVPIVSPLPSGPITGFGATIAAWATVHTRSSEPVAGEPTASYWGPKTSSASVFAHEFVVHQLADDRVVALSINLPKGTLLAEAEREAFSELPADHKETFNEILRNDVNGNSCLLVNMKSAALAAVLNGPPFNDPSGIVGIEFATLISDTAIGYSTSNIDGAFLQTRPNTTQSSC